MTDLRTGTGPDERSGAKPSLYEFTPREQGVIAGLADVWRSNPYPEGRTVPNYDHNEWQRGFRDGQAIREVTVEKEYAGD